MVDRIDRLYGDQNTPRPAHPQERKDNFPVRSDRDSAEEGRLRRENVAERIAPHLQDKVELSDKAREASRAERVTRPESPLSEQQARELADGWYAAGIRTAYEQLER